jgi:hypothetical protein
MLMSSINAEGARGWSRRDRARVAGRSDASGVLDTYLRGLAPGEVQATYAWVNRQFDQALRARTRRLNLTASVGSDWTGTPLQPLYSKAANDDFTLAALLVANIYARVACRREEPWVTFQQFAGDHTSRSYLLDPAYVLPCERERA